MFSHTPAAMEQRCSRQFLFHKFCLLSPELFSLCVCVTCTHAHMHMNTEGRPGCWVSVCITLHVIFLIRCVTELKIYQSLLRGWLTREHSRCAHFSVPKCCGWRDAQPCCLLMRVTDSNSGSHIYRPRPQHLSGPRVFVLTSHAS